MTLAEVGFGIEKVIGSAAAIPFALLNREVLVRLDSAERLPATTRPDNVDADDPARLRPAEPKGKRKLALGKIARSRLHHLRRARKPRRSQCHLGSDRVAVRSRANGLDTKHVVLVSIVVPQQPGRSVGGGEQHIEIAVTIKVQVGGAATNRRLAEGRTYLFRDILKAAVSTIPKQQSRLGVLHGWLHNAHVVGNVAIGSKDVRQAIQVVIEEERC